MKLKALLTPLLLAGVSLPLSAQLVVDFESPTYSTGEINNQGVFNDTGAGGTTAGLWTVTASGTLASTETTGSGYARIDLTSAQLGVPDISNLTDPVEFAFDVFLPTNDANSNIIANITVRNSTSFGQQLLSLQIRNDGRLRANGNNFNNALDSTGFVEVVTLLDFSTDTFSLTVAGTELSPSIAFDNASTGISQIRFDQTNDSDPIEVDNVSLTAIPEPSVYGALAGVLALAMVVYRRKARR